MRLILVLLAAAVVGWSEPPQEAIERVLDAQVRAWNAADIDGFMAGYENSSDTVFIGTKIQRGYEAVRQRYHERYPNRERMGQLSFSDISIRMLGADYASVTGAFRLQRTQAA